MARSTNGKVRKTDRKKLLRHLANIREGFEPRIEALPEPFAKHIRDLCDEVASRIEDQDYMFAIRALYRHMVSTLERMESGEIIGLADDGSYRIRTWSTL